VKKTRIAIVLNSRFPTNKAYGVTTRMTLETLLREKYNTKIFSSPSNYLDDDYTRIMSRVLHFQQNFMVKNFIRFGEKGSSKFHQIFWFIGQNFQVITNLSKIRNFEPNVLWLRDPWIALLLLRKIKNSRIILEVHGRSAKVVYKILYKYKSRISFFAINGINERYLKTIMPNIEVGLAPMGIDKTDLASLVEIKQFIRALKDPSRRFLKIGYVGKISPQGYSKGVEDLISLGVFFKTNSLPHKITLIGHTDQELRNLLRAKGDLILEAKNISFIPHMSHTSAVKSMKDFDILVLPLPFDSNYQGMPLKLLEYLSSGRIVIVAESEYIREMFNDGFYPYFYEQGNINSLYCSINAYVNEKDLERHILDGVSFASKFTWESRTKSVLNMVLI
jgi:glycosyltransferase involved in cell wall biosynthesis